MTAVLGTSDGFSKGMRDEGGLYQIQLDSRLGGLGGLDLQQSHVETRLEVRSLGGGAGY